LAFRKGSLGRSKQRNENPRQLRDLNIEVVRKWMKPIKRNLIHTSRHRRLANGKGSEMMMAAFPTSQTDTVLLPTTCTAMDTSATGPTDKGPKNGRSRRSCNGFLCGKLERC